MGAVPPLPQYAFMAWSSVRGSTGTTLPLGLNYLYLKKSPEKELSLLNSLSSCCIEDLFYTMGHSANGDMYSFYTIVLR